MFRTHRFIKAAVAFWFASASLASAFCVGDCDDGGSVTVEELVRAVAITLGDKPLDDCAACDRDGNGSISVDELVVAVTYALRGCPTSTPVSGDPYDLSGTLNDKPTQGELVLEFVRFEPNLLRYRINAFRFGDLSGVGTAHLFTLNNSFTVSITGHAREADEIFLEGGASVLSTAPLTFGEFMVSGEGYTLRFTATLR